MTTHYEDEDQAERLKQWWKENWLALAAGLGIGLGAIFGWEAWQSRSASQAQSASRMYEELKLALGDERSEDARRIGDALAAEHAGSPYAAGAALQLAAVAARGGDFDAALARLRWVREHAGDEGLRQVARLREARVLWQQGQADAALSLLETEVEPFDAAVEELRGDIRLAQGDRAGAREAYEKALAATEDDPALRSGLQRKIDDLADVVQS